MCGERWLLNVERHKRDFTEGRVAGYPTLHETEWQFDWICCWMQSLTGERL